MHRFARTSCFIGVLTGALWQSVVAQQTPTAPRAPTRVPAAVALTDSLPVPGAPYLILRNPGGSRRDVILLPTGADAALLSDAVRTLLAARQAGGDTAAETATLRLRPRSGIPPRRGFPWAARVMADVRRAAPGPVPGVGSARAVEIWLPRQNVRRSVRPGERPAAPPRGSSST